MGQEKESFAFGLSTTCSGLNILQHWFIRLEGSAVSASYSVP